MRRHHLALGALLAALVALALGGCQGGSAASGPTRRAAPGLVRASPSVALRAPGQAILDDGAVGLPRLAGRDHLSAAEAARDQPDERRALEVFAGWGWTDMSTRQWGGAGRALRASVLLTLRPAGARLAFAQWSDEVSRAPLAAGPCTAVLDGLDDCRQGTAEGRAALVGRLDSEVFRLEGSGEDVRRLAPLQAARLRAQG